MGLSSHGGGEIGAAVPVERPAPLVLGALVTGSEYGWVTLKTVLAQRPGRLAVLGGRVTAAALVTAVMVVVSLAADALASWAIATAEH